MWCQAKPGNEQSDITNARRETNVEDEEKENTRRLKN